MRGGIPHYRECFNHEEFTQTLLLRQQSYKEKCDSKVIQAIRQRRAAATAESRPASAQSEPQTALNIADQKSAMNHNAAPYPKRAAWFQKEFALREWNVHGLQAQGGPDWKTSRKVLDGLRVSRSVLEKIALALSSPKRQVLLRDIPPD